MGVGSRIALVRQTVLTIIRQLTQLFSFQWHCLHPREIHYSRLLRYSSCTLQLHSETSVGR